ncbi:MAG: FG-GAP-like repeat-containing protein, partial [Phycisphaerales bacterium]
MRRISLWVVVLGVVLSAGARPAVAEFSFEASATSIAVPDGPGSIEGMGESFDVSPSTGVGTYGLALPVPPGPGGFAPSVGVQYQTGAGNGLMGVGWGMSTPRICRKTDAGQPVYGGPDGADAFMVKSPKASGDLVPVPEWDGYWGIRHEGAFFRFKPASEKGDGHGWLVESPRGTTFFYGTTTESREGPDPSSFDQTFCWTLTEKQDVFGHRIRYEYRRDGGRLYLSEIRYGEETPSPRSVRLSYEERDDRLGDWRAGYLRAFNLRLKSLTAVVEHSQLTGTERTLAQMRFSYEDHYNTSRLVGVELEGEHGETLPAQSFDYIDFEPEQAESFQVSSAPRIDPTSPGHRLLDVDGDALPDLVRARHGSWEYYRNTGGTSFGDARPIDGLDSIDGTAVDWQVADLDGDGLRDVVVRNGTGDLRWYRNTSPMDGESARFEYQGELGAQLPVTLSDPTLKIVDVNQDRRVDFVYTTGGTLRGVLSKVHRDDDGRVRATSRVTYSSWTPDEPAVDGLAQLSFSAPGLFLADMNGDGLDDLVRAFGGAGQTTSIAYHAARGTGRFGPATPLSGLPDGIKNAEPSNLRLVDLNTDGLGDVVVQDQSQVRYWLNQGGTRFDGPYVQDIERGTQATVAFTDFNGNGSLDVVVAEADQTTWKAYDLIGAPAVGLLTHANNGLGGRYTLRYASSTEAAAEAAEAGVPWRRYTPQSLTVVRERTLSNGRGFEAKTSTIYRDAYWDTDAATFRSFRAASVKRHGDEHAPARVTDHLFYVGVGDERAGFGGMLGQEPTYFGGDTEALAGRTRAVVARTEDGAMFSQSVSRYELEHLAGGRTLVLSSGSFARTPERALAAPELGTLDAAFGWDGPTLRDEEDGERARWYTLTEGEHDEFGNPVRSIKWGYVTATGEDISG